MLKTIFLYSIYVIQTYASNDLRDNMCGTVVTSVLELNENYKSYAKSVKTNHIYERTSWKIIKGVFKFVLKGRDTYFISSIGYIRFLLQIIRNLDSVVPT